MTYVSDVMQVGALTQLLCHRTSWMLNVVKQINLKVGNMVLTIYYTEELRAEFVSKANTCHSK